MNLNSFVAIFAVIFKRVFQNPEEKRCEKANKQERHQVDRFNHCVEHEMFVKKYSGG